MSRFQRHVFICINERAAADPKGCCLAKGSAEVRELFKQGLKSRGLNRIVRANAAGCLDACAYGVTVVIYPEAVWYGGVTPADVEEIIEKHVIGGQVVERLRMRAYPSGSASIPPLQIPAVENPRPAGRKDPAS